MAVKAKRGDWLAVVRTERTFYIGRPTEERERVDLVRVTSCTRDGYVKECEDVAGYKNGAWASARVLVIPPTMVAPDDVLRVGREHHYDGHPNQPRPFDSLEELRDALRPFRVAPA